MKIRSGFVSNSSSSSFVCLGIDISDNEELKNRFFDSKNYCIKDDAVELLPPHTDFHYYDSEVLGWELGSGSSDDGSFSCSDVNFDELANYVQEFEKVTGIKPKLMGGTYAS